MNLVITITGTSSCFAVSGNPVESVFTSIYQYGNWGTNEEGKGFSGLGSKLEHCKHYIAFLEQFLQKNQITSVVDFGCGDWTFSQYIRWGDIHYTGFDVVKSVVDDLKKKYSSPLRQFIHADGLSTDLPAADLLICKDVLQHLSNENIHAFLKQCSKFKYCLITNDVDPATKTSTNPDIKNGYYRFLDITQAPFNVQGEKVLTYISRGTCTAQVVLITNSKD